MSTRSVFLAVACLCILQPTFAGHGLSGGVSFENTEGKKLTYPAHAPDFEPTSKSNVVDIAHYNLEKQFPSWNKGLTVDEARAGLQNLYEKIPQKPTVVFSHTGIRCGLNAGEITYQVVDIRVSSSVNNSVQTSPFNIEATKNATYKIHLYLEELN